MTKKHMWILILCCLIPVAALAAVLVFRLPASSAVILGLVLLCPLSHVVMMALMGHDLTSHHDSPAARPQTSVRHEGSG